MKTSKKLVLFCDGTWNDLRMANRTNVSQLAQAVEPEDHLGRKQIVFYQEGVGVGSNIGPITDRAVRLVGGAFGNGLDRKVEEAYRFLVLNYEPGDDLYIFGFSRGAFTARSLCGMIRKIGILKRNCFDRSVAAFGLYADKNLRSDDPKMIEFRLFYSHDVASGPSDYSQYLSDGRLGSFMPVFNTPVDGPQESQTLEELFQYRDTGTTRQFLIDRSRAGLDQTSEGTPMRTYRLMYLGLWDTVASMGLPDRAGAIARLYNGRYTFYDMDTDPLVSSVRHAVSIDENRRVFSSVPVSNIEALDRLWAKRTGWDVADDGAQLEPEAPLNKKSKNYVPYRCRPYQQRWFPGDHGAVGGGNPVKGLSNYTLLWIAEGAAWAGLALDWEAGTLAHALSRIDYMVDWPNRGRRDAIARAGGSKSRSGPERIQELGDTAYARYCADCSEIPLNVGLMKGQPCPRPLQDCPAHYPSTQPFLRSELFRDASTPAFHKSAPAC